jgi:hypothetical protein
MKVQLCLPFSYEVMKKMLSLENPGKIHIQLYKIYSIKITGASNLQKRETP